MKNKQAIYFIVLLIMVGVGQWLAQKNDQKKSLNYLSNISGCDPTQGNCLFGKNQNSGEQPPYKLEFSQLPSALTPFNVQVIVDNPQLEGINITFEMKSMDMGYNHYSLVQSAQTWRANVILPACSLNRQDWLLSVNMIFEDKIEVARFKFILPKE